MPPQPPRRRELKRRGAYARLSLSTPRDRNRVLDLRNVIRDSRYRASSRAVYNRHAEQYVAFCRDYGLDPWPCTYDTLSVFFTFHLSAGLSVTSLPSIQSALKAENRSQRFDWLSPLDKDLMRDFMTGAQKAFPRSPRRKLPITLDILTRLTQQVLRATPPLSASSLRFLAMAWVAHDALLRFSELLQLEAKDVVWNHDDGTVALILRQTKTSTDPQVVHLVDYGEFSGYRIFAHYWNLHRFHEQPGTARLFTDSRGSSPYVFKNSFLRLLEYYLERAGVPEPRRYSGHSFRSGGATDLWDARVSPRLIQLIGRWRSEAFWIYVRDHPTERAMEAATAFRRRLRELYNI